MSGRIRNVGESALLMELQAVIDPDVNTKAIGVAITVAKRGITGVLDVVPTFHTVAVYFDPLVADVDALRAALEEASVEPVEENRGEAIEIPVVYGGEGGPDLEEVAGWAGMAPASVVERHAAVEYRVYMVGFLPGFAYLAPVDPAIAAPRRKTPRVRVAAGSVGIAGGQTGIYPFESPGGWQIIGRTATPMFDGRRQPPSLLSPGDRVRFVPITLAGAPDVAPDVASGFSRTSGPSPGFEDRAVTVLKPGFLTTVQDEGRWGYQSVGVPVSGAMDLDAHRAANLIVGNDPGAATLEATIVGPELRVEVATMVAVAGADFEPTVDGVRVPSDAPVSCRAGGVLRFGRRRAGGRAYVAFPGGIAVPSVLGSRATHARTGMGGVQGRAVRAGDRLPLGMPSGSPSRSIAPLRHSGSGVRLRVMRGPQEDAFPSEAYDSLTATRFLVAPDSDRMGFRLTSERPIARLTEREMISGATFPGAIQVPASGQPILLMADRPTTGGYPQMAVVIAADLPLAGQLIPGDSVEFGLCSMGEAIAALRERRRSGDVPGARA